LAVLLAEGSDLAQHGVVELCALTAVHTQRTSIKDEREREKRDSLGRNGDDGEDEDNEEGKEERGFHLWAQGGSSIRRDERKLEMKEEEEGNVWKSKPCDDRGPRREREKKKKLARKKSLCVCGKRKKMIQST
jgi:hypothetical protein